MALRLISEISLPPHKGKGGFDHAAYYSKDAHLYVAHTANHSLEVIDCKTDRHVRTLEGFPGVAGALVSEEMNLVFTSNRGANSVGIFTPNRAVDVKTVSVGVRPNGLAFDAERGILLSANVGDPSTPGTFTLSFVNVMNGALIAEIPVPGRTRWAVYDALTSNFFVNIADPACIVCVSAANPNEVAKVYEVNAVGPHGLDMDFKERILFCACDSGDLISLNTDTGKILSRVPLAGTPDVIFFNRTLKHLYVTTGNPGVIEVFSTDKMDLLETVKTEEGTHTIGYDWERNKVYAFLPESCRAFVYQDE